MSSTTNTTTSITESITSKDYKTGYEYTVTGTGIKHDGGSMSPDATQVTGTVGGQSYTWTGADMTTKPNWTQTNPHQEMLFNLQKHIQDQGFRISQL